MGPDRNCRAPTSTATIMLVSANYSLYELYVAALKVLVTVSVGKYSACAG